MWDWANKNIANFSDWGKRCLKAEKEAANQRQERAPEHGEFSLQEITELVQDLIKTELAGHIIAPDQMKGGDGDQAPDLSGYF